MPESIGEETDEQLKVFVTDLKWVHFVAMLQRPGVSACMETLEETHYKPGTDANGLFELRLKNWEGIIGVIVSIPVEDKPKMERAAAANGLRIANGVPHMISGGKVSHFPIENDWIFTLENVPGHPVYKNQGAKA